MENNKEIRFDHKVIVDLIKPNSRVLDLGCGNGELLELLKINKSVKGTGVEIDENAIYNCIEKGITISHGNIDTGLIDYGTKRFDYVILNESLQQVLHPQKVILESLRVGKNVIVNIPNFCHIEGRLQIFFKGRVPMTKELPYEWFDTPNLRFLSLKDFRRFCRVNGIVIEKEIPLGYKNIIGFLPNLFARSGLYLLSKQ